MKKLLALSALLTLSACVSTDPPTPPPDWLAFVLDHYFAIGVMAAIAGATWLANGHGEEVDVTDLEHLFMLTAGAALIVLVWPGIALAGFVAIAYRIILFVVEVTKGVKDGTQN